MKNYDIDTSYTSLMNEKIQLYNKIVRQAEIQNRESNGAPTRKEGELYLEASKVCAEIMNLNLSQRSVYNQWNLRKTDCENEVKRITKSVMPKAASTPPSAADLSQSEPGEQRKPDYEKANSSFKTKNACRDISADTISRWYKDKPLQSFKDVKGMEEVKSILESRAANLGWDRIDSALKINPVQSYFFYGPPGTGKTFIIEAFASEMMDKGFKYIRLLGGDIHASLVGVAEKTVQVAFQEAIDNEPCIIFIDEIENVCVSRSGRNVEGHEKRLTVAFLEAYNLLKESGKRVIFMGATNYPGLIDEAMLDRITMIRIPLPPTESRKKFFESKLESITIESGYSFEDMAEATENYSFRDLERLTDALSAKLKDVAIEAYRVNNDDGTINRELTDIAAAEAVSDGRVQLSKEFFELMQKELPPSDKTVICEGLEAFEARVKRINA